MKSLILHLLICLFPALLYAQSGNPIMCTWMKGDNTIGQPGVYGVCGAASPSNKPGARVFSTTWKDPSGGLWMYGGYGVDITGETGYLNDLWKFDPVANAWTWMKGDNTIQQEAVYGQQGQAASPNKPGSGYASGSWTDAEGNFWMFGGFGYTSGGFGFLNALWKYSIATNTWTWMNGDATTDEPGVYGVKGHAHAHNKPGARYGCRTWTDAQGNLWLFGGYGYDRTNAGMLSDLWKYSIITNQWTWVSGNDVVDIPGSYGTPSVASSSSSPGARYLGSSWIDASNNLWLYGGFGVAEGSAGSLNDLWKYSITTNQWTWLKGDSVLNISGEYNVAAINKKPGARYLSASWTDSENNLWLFGGYGMAGEEEGYLNDVWKYDVQDNTWSWVKGDSTANQYAIYNTQGLPLATAKSGARTSSISWTDNSGNPWFFGGYGYSDQASGMLNDLWKVSSWIVLPVTLKSFDGIREKDEIKLHWSSVNELNLSGYVLQRSTDGANFTDIARMAARGAESLSNYGYIDLVNKESSNRFFYRLRFINMDSSSSYSRVLRFDRPTTVSDLQLYPNPSTGPVTLSFTQAKPGLLQWRILNASGRVVKQQQSEVRAGRISLQVSAAELPAGAYILSVSSEGSSESKAFILQ